MFRIYACQIICCYHTKHQNSLKNTEFAEYLSVGLFISANYKQCNANQSRVTVCLEPQEVKLFIYYTSGKDKKSIPYLNISAKRGTNLYLPLINVTLVYRLYQLKKRKNVR